MTASVGARRIALWLCRGGGGHFTGILVSDALQQLADDTGKTLTRFAVRDAEKDECWCAMAPSRMLDHPGWKPDTDSVDWGGGGVFLAWPVRGVT